VEAVLCLVGHGIFASGRDHKVIDTVAIEIADELGRSTQQGAIFAKLFSNVLVGGRRHGSRSMGWRRRQWFLRCGKCRRARSDQESNPYHA
jgi:hypothetical protein